MNELKKATKITGSIITALGCFLIVFFSFNLSSFMMSQSQLNWWRFLVNDYLNNTRDRGAYLYAMTALGFAVLMIGFFVLLFGHRPLASRVAALVAGIIAIFQAIFLFLNSLFYSTILATLRYVDLLNGAFRIVEYYIPIILFGIAALAVIVILIGLLRYMNLVAKIFAFLCVGAFLFTVIYDVVVFILLATGSSWQSDVAFSWYSAPIIGYLLLGITLLCMIPTAGKLPPKHKEKISVAGLKEQITAEDDAKTVFDENQNLLVDRRVTKLDLPFSPEKSLALVTEVKIYQIDSRVEKDLAEEESKTAVLEQPNLDMENSPESKASEPTVSEENLSLEETIMKPTDQVIQEKSIEPEKPGIDKAKEEETSKTE